MTLVSCTTKFQDTGTSTSVSQMLTNEWHIKSYDLSKPVLIDNEFEMREGFIMNGYFFLKHFSLTDGKSFGLDYSESLTEKIPMVVKSFNKMDLKRTEFKIYEP